MYKNYLVVLLFKCIKVNILLFEPLKKMTKDLLILKRKFLKYLQLVTKQILKRTGNEANITSLQAKA